MTRVCLPSARHLILPTLLAVFLTALGPVPGAVASEESPDPAPDIQEARVLAPVPLPVAALSDRVDARAAMPLERDIDALRGLHDMLNAGDTKTRGEAAHRVSVLATNEDNVPHLEGFVPVLKDIAFDYGAADKTRLMALSALYQVSPNQAFFAIRGRVENEPSERVRITMQNMLRGAETPERAGVAVF